jgi:hypothetical protein
MTVGAGRGVGGAAADTQGCLSIWFAPPDALKGGLGPCLKEVRR